MKANYRLKTYVTFLLLLTSLAAAGCGAARSSYKKGTKAEIARDYEVAMEQYRQAMVADPTNIEYRLKYEQTRFSAAYVHFQNGRRALAAGDAVRAKAEFLRATEIDPSHDFARQELADADRMLQNRSQNQTDPILDFDKMMEAARTDPNIGRQMKTNLNERISFNITASSRVVYENLAQQAGFQVIFRQQSFRPTNVTISLQDVNIFEALDLVGLQTGTFWQPINETTILVMDDNQQNRRDFEDHILKTVYLSNVTSTNDLNGILNVLRTALGVRGIFQSEQQNAIVIHDTPARVAMIENVIRALDKAKAEVVIDVTVMEVDRNTLRDLGITPPTDSVMSFNSLRGANGNEISLKDANNVGSGNFSVSVNDTIARFLAQNNTAKLLQNPRLRTTDGTTASLRVGSEVPVPTTSFQNTNIGGGATTSYTLQQVGVQLDILSKVLLNRDVSLNVTVTVRALAGDRAVGTVNIPVFSNRIVAHTIRLKEGETNILGGIISETESETMSGIPGLKNVPLLKYLFGSEHKQRDQAEVIIMLTPHIYRMPQINEEDVRGVIVGGENNLRLRPDYGSPTPLPLVPAARPPATAPGPSSAVPAAPAAPTTAQLSFPAPVTLTPQGETPVSLAINGPNILGTELKLSFDPSAFTIKDVRDGGFLSQGNQVIALVHNIDNQRGTATVSLERSPNAPLVTGTGTLVTLMLQPGARKGPSSLKVTEFGVRDARQLHPGTSTEVQVTVP
jgi:general secretion pathway protein D